MTSLLSTTDHYYGLPLQYCNQPPPPVAQTVSSVRFNDCTQHSDSEMHALRAMLLAHGTLPYAGRRAWGNTKNNTLNNRLAYVEALVDTNALVIETMWYNTNTSPSSRQAAVVSLRTFIQEVLKRSRTTYSTLQTALFYLFRSQPAITAHLRQQAQHDKWEGTYINCGRRMFLASLVVASKFVQDKTYRNSAWAKIAGLPVAEINAAERIFLTLVDYRLFISQTTFEQWHHLLHVHVEAKTQQHPMIPMLPYSLNQAFSTPLVAATRPPSPSSATSKSTSSSPSSSSSPSTLPQSSLPYHQNMGCQPTTSKRKRQRTSTDTFSPSFCSTPMPVLTISVPSSSDSSPLHTPTQISPIRSQLWKPSSPKKRKLDTDEAVGQSRRQWKHRCL